MSVLCRTRARSREQSRGCIPTSKVPDIRAENGPLTSRGRQCKEMTRKAEGSPTRPTHALVHPQIDQKKSASAGAGADVPSQANPPPRQGTGLESHREPRPGTEQTGALRALRFDTFFFWFSLTPRAPSASVSATGPRPARGLARWVSGGVAVGCRPALRRHCAWVSWSLPCAVVLRSFVVHAGSAVSLGCIECLDEAAGSQTGPHCRG